MQLMGYHFGWISCHSAGIGGALQRAAAAGACRAAHASRPRVEPSALAHQQGTHSFLPSRSKVLYTNRAAPESLCGHCTRSQPRPGQPQGAVIWSIAAQEPQHAPASQPTASRAPQPPSVDTTAYAVSSNDPYGATPHATDTTAASPAAAPSPLPTPDWARLSACCGAQHFALLPLVSSGAIVGALQICLGDPTRSGHHSRPLLSHPAHVHLTHTASNSHPFPGAVDGFISAATTGGIAHQLPAASSAAHAGDLARAAPHSISGPTPLPSAPMHPGTGAGPGAGAGVGEGLAHAHASNGGAAGNAPGTGVPTHTTSARRLHAPPPASQRRQEPAAGGQQAAGPDAQQQQEQQGSSPVPNWLPHHLPELQQLAVVVGLSCFTAASGGLAGGLAALATPPTLCPVLGAVAAGAGAGAGVTGVAGSGGQLAGSSSRLLARGVAMSVTHAARLLATPLHQVGRGGGGAPKGGAWGLALD